MYVFLVYWTCGDEPILQRAFSTKEKADAFAEEEQGDKVWEQWFVQTIEVF